MVRSSVFSLLLILAITCVTTGCSGANSSSKSDTRSYTADFKRVVLAAADATRDAGLSIETAEEVKPGEFQIIASKFERLRGEREPIRVADIVILVQSASGGAVNVDIEQKKLSPTSTIGTSTSEQVSYPIRIYKRLERRLES